MNLCETDFTDVYDIFRNMPHGTKVWVCEVSNVQKAKTLLLALERDDPAEYCLCDLTRRKVLGDATPERPQLHVSPEHSNSFWRF